MKTGKLLMRIRTDRRGSSLAGVMIILTLFIALGAAMLTAAASAVATSITLASSQQAYFTARSAVSAMANYIKSDGSLDSIVTTDPGNPVYGSGGSASDQMGTYGVTVSYLTEPHDIFSATPTGNIKITATAKRGSGTRRVAGYLQKATAFDNMVYLNGDLGKTDAGPATYSGSLAVNGSVELGSSTIIDGSLTAAGDVTLGADSKVNGDVYASGSITGTSHIYNGTPHPNADVRFPSLNTINPPTMEQDPQLYTNIYNGSNVTVTGDGTLTGSIHKITMSAAGDVRLLADSIDFKGITIENTTKNNLYLYLTGSTAIELKNGDYIGTSSNNDKMSVNVYLIGNGNQKIDMSGQSSMAAYVYIPNGSLSATGGGGDKQSIFGSLVVKGIDIKSQLSLSYIKPPDLTGTPLDGALNQAWAYGTFRWASK